MKEVLQWKECDQCVWLRARKSKNSGVERKETRIEPCNNAAALNERINPAFRKRGQFENGLVLLNRGATSVGEKLEVLDKGCVSKEGEAGAELAKFTTLVLAT